MFRSLGAKNTAAMSPGERIIVVSPAFCEISATRLMSLTLQSQLTPGGGGYGKAGEQSKVKLREDHEAHWKKGSLGSRLAEWESSS